MTTATSNSATQVARGFNWNNFFKGMKMPHPPGKPDKQLPLRHRVAFLLDWAAKKSGGLLIPYNIVLKFIMGYEHTPQLRSKEVERLRKGLAGSRQLLQSQFKRDLYNVSGIGVRATASDLDVVQRSIPRNVRNFNSAREALGRNVALVNPNRLPEGPDKNWFVRQVSPAYKALTNDDRILKLLPPAVPGAVPTSNGVEKK